MIAEGKFGAGRLEPRSVVLFLTARALQRSRRRRGDLLQGDGETRPLPTTFAPEEVRILSTAYEEACAFLSKDGTIGPAKRHEIARVIVSHATRGLRDVHRLALKAIVHVG